MIDLTHDPSEYIRGLQQLLVSDKKKIAFLFGAGTSLAVKNEHSLYIPSMAKMTEQIELELSKKKKYEFAIGKIKEEIGEENFNIESFLSNVLDKKNIVGNEKLNGLCKVELEELIKETKNLIRQIVSVHNEINDKNLLDNMTHLDFAEWVGRANRKCGIEIFTTNYDYFFELGMEEKSIPYFDGFSGSYRPFFCPESVDDLAYLPKQTKLWKLHGSLGWHLNDSNDNNIEKVIRRDSDGDDILIYPSTLKYADSKKQPYISLMDRLTDFLKQPDTILITCGYSFQDLHINERILTALKSNTAAHVYVLYYDRVDGIGKEKKYILTETSPLSKLAKANSKLSVLGCRNAVIGCRYGEWKLQREPDKEDTINISTYYDEDGPSYPDILMKKDYKGGEKWTGKGELTLPDFNKFVMFLHSMIMKTKDSEASYE